MTYNPQFKNISPRISTEFLVYITKHNILAKIQSASHEKLDLDMAFLKNGSYLGAINTPMTELLQNAAFVTEGAISLHNTEISEEID